ncbi:hypothetical protein LAV82_23235 [Bacillus sp. ILBB4]|nr:hypothetical protein [Bacillus sp. ILBB4]
MSIARIDKEIETLQEEMRELDVLYLSKQKDLRRLKKMKEKEMVAWQAADNWKATHHNITEHFQK